MTKEFAVCLVGVLCSALFFAKTAVYLRNRFGGAAGHVLYMMLIICGGVLGVAFLLPVL